MTSRMENMQVYRRRIMRSLQESNTEMVEKQHKIAYEKQFQIGDIVYVKRNIRAGANYKLLSRYEGPYHIVEKLFENKYKVRHMYDDSLRVVHADKLKLFQEAADDLSKDNEDNQDRQIRKSERLQNQIRINY